MKKFIITAESRNTITVGNEENNAKLYGATIMLDFAYADTKQEALEEIAYNFNLPINVLSIYEVVDNTLKKE